MNEEDKSLPEAEATIKNPKMSTRNVDVFYGDFQAIKDVSIDVDMENVTAFIGPSGCGKSTFLRTLNRMNDTIPTARVEGRIELDGEDIYSPSYGCSSAARARRHGIPEA